MTKLRTDRYERSRYHHTQLDQIKMFRFGNSNLRTNLSRWLRPTSIRGIVFRPDSFRETAPESNQKISTPLIVTDSIPGPKSLVEIKKLSKYQDVRTTQLVMDTRKSFGNYFVDIDGNAFLDYHSMISSIAIGYNNPAFKKLDPDTLFDLINRPALGVFPPEYLYSGVEKIMSKSPKGLDKLFLSTSGSDANEIAFKLAFMRYQHDRRGFSSEFSPIELGTAMANQVPGSPNLSVLSFKGGFHGRLMGSLSATRSKPIHKVDIPAFDWPVAPFPQLSYPLGENAKKNREEEDRCLHIVESIIKESYGSNPVAALIVEPVQAEGGDNHATPHFFQGLRRITRNYGITFIVDEVQTGCGGTGRFWAHEHWDLDESPDIVTFAKKMQAAGVYYKTSYLPSHPFRNFNTWMGNPLDILKAGIIIDHIDRHHLLPKTTHVGEILINELKQNDRLINVRGSGTFIAFDMENQEDRDRLIVQMRNRGVLINGCGAQTIRLRPMLINDNVESYDFLAELDESLKSI